MYDKPIAVPARLPTRFAGALRRLRSAGFAKNLPTSFKRRKSSGPSTRYFDIGIDKRVERICVVAGNNGCRGLA